MRGGPDAAAHRWIGIMKIYQGVRTPHGCSVTVNGAPLDPRVDLRQHSAGIEWGYEGSAPRQLALAILCDYFGDDARALQQYAMFMAVVVGELKGDQWTLTDDQIKQTFEQVVEVPMDLQTLLDKVRGRR